MNMLKPRQRRNKKYRYSSVTSRQLERLEDRTYLAADWRNPANSLDVNHDTYITPIDALLVINELNRGRESDLGARPTNEEPVLPYFDSSGDGQISPIDALLVINALNRTERVPVYRLLEGDAYAVASTNLIALGQVGGTRTVRL